MRALFGDVQLPKPKQPEYMKWDKKQLQNEYFALRIKYTAQSLELGRRDAYIEKVDAFLNALSDLQQLEN